MDYVARSLRAWSVPMVVSVPQAHAALGGDAEDPAVTAQLHSLGAEVARAAEQLTRTGTCDYADARAPGRPANDRARAAAPPSGH